ncbi:hypothetical protein EDC01DRAFT_720028 [Geopyxis carbonaria]|nr:hypothetical protein EDC01DRAFT_720028 [Geopyxis carbonaria]
MSGSTVHVANISHSTTQSELSSFFSFCGKITSITLTPTTAAPDSPKSATITFERESAAKTAVLLDGTPLNNIPLSVTSAHNIDEIAGDHLAPASSPGPDGDFHQEDKPRAAIFAEYLSSGYVLGDAVLQRGIEFDRAQGITAKFAGLLKTLDSKTHALDRAKTMDSQYHLSEKAEGARGLLGRYFEKALETGAGQKVRQFYQDGEKQVVEIHAEAKRLADFKKQQQAKTQEGEQGLGKTADGKPFVAPDSTTCPCGGAAGACGCEPGKRGECSGDRCQANFENRCSSSAQSVFHQVNCSVPRIP